MRGGGRDGRGNLRENREDPAPTVGICWDGIAIQMPTIAAAIRIPCHPRRPRFLSRRGTPRRYVLREMELLD